MRFALLALSFCVLVLARGHAAEAPKDKAQQIPAPKRTLTGTLSRNVVLLAKGGPYAVEKRVLVPEGGTLRIEAGTRLVGGEGSALVVETGALIIKGNARAHVVFDRIGLYSGSVSDVTIQFCDFVDSPEAISLPGDRQAKKALKSVSFAGCSRVDIRGDKLSLDSCSFDRCSLTTSYSGTFPLVTGCRFTGCTIALGCLVGSRTSTFSGCKFDENANLDLARTALVSTCTFCDDTWNSLQECLRHATFPHERLRVVRGKTPKEEHKRKD